MYETKGSPSSVIIMPFKLMHAACMHRCLIQWDPSPAPSISCHASRLLYPQVSDSLVAAVDRRRSLMEGLMQSGRQPPAGSTAIQVGFSIMHANKLGSALLTVGMIGSEVAAS